MVPGAGLPSTRASGHHYLPTRNVEDVPREVGHHGGHRFGKMGYSAPMPCGKVHLTLELATLPGWVALGAVLGGDRSSLLVFTGAYVAASLFLSPDLDLAHSGASRRWQGARFLWRPYAVLFRHRGLSHSPLAGPVTRLLYLAVLAGVGWALLHAVAGVPLPRAAPWGAAVPAVTGVFLPQLLHVGLDRIASLAKRLLRRR